MFFFYRSKIDFPDIPPQHNMCATTNANTLSALQTAVLQGIKIDSPENTDNINMQHIIQQITEFVNAPDNHTPAALDEFKKLEQLITEQRRSLTTKVSAAKKIAAADERRAETERNAETKRREKEQVIANRKVLADRKKKQKSALINLSKMLKKPKSPIAHCKDDTEVRKWAMIGAKTNYAPIRVTNNNAKRERVKMTKEADAVARKVANAGKPKNGDYARFCSWFKCDSAEIDAAGCDGNDRGQRAIGASIVPLNIPEAKRNILLYKRCLAGLLTA